MAVEERTLVARDITKSYGKKRVVENVSLSINGGEIVGLLGPNGAGKTTSFYCIVGLVKMDAGTITINGNDVSKAPMHERARQGLGYLPQEASVFRRLTVRDNLIAVLELRSDLDKAERTATMERLLDEFQLVNFQDTRGEQLSGGERRRLEIARALASAPGFMLLDEPFAGVDPISVGDIKDNIRRLMNYGIGVLITDHNVRETLDICDRAYIVSEGHIIAEGDAEAILANEQVRRVYLGESFSL